MNKLKQLYYVSVDDVTDYVEEAVRRKETYEKQKKEYILICKNERKSRYSFVQRNGFYLSILSILLIGISLLCIFNGFDNISDIYISTEKVELSKQLENETKVGASVTKNEEKQQVDSVENETKENDKVSSTTEYNVGMVVYFSGNCHYESSYSNASSIECTSGKAIITKINKNEAHPYHLQSKEEACNVYGWVDEKDIKLIETSKND